MNLPEYFDSQAQAAAMLNLSVYDIKSAKAEGCPAFRGGRIRTKEFQTWLKLNRPDLDRVELPFVSATVDWQDKYSRREVLFSLNEYLETAFVEKQITLKQFCATCDQTVPLVIKLGRVWRAGIDEPGYRACRRRVKENYREEAKSSANSNGSDAEC
jgi:hypothetical protein